MTPEDASEVAELIYASINVWYRDNGHSEIQFQGGPGVTEVFYETYHALAPGATVVAVSPASGRIMGSCFFHPRPTHVGLGIMNVHPNYFGLGVAKALVRHICDYTDANGHPALRLTSSALNLDSFALYSRNGFIPRLAYQDMWVKVPQGGLGASVPGRDRVRPAAPADDPAMEALELEVSGVSRGPDYAHAIENAQGFWSAAVLESASGGIDAYAIYRAGRAPYQAQQPVALLVADRAQLHSPRHSRLPTQDQSERPLRRDTRDPPPKPANVAGQSARSRGATSGSDSAHRPATRRPA